eukprot:scaffold29499_cov60-Phaeocystis_antarctica.AAC.2
MIIERRRSRGTNTKGVTAPVSLLPRLWEMLGIRMRVISPWEAARCHLRRCTSWVYAGFSTSRALNVFNRLFVERWIQ